MYFAIFINLMAIGRNNTQKNYIIIIIDNNSISGRQEEKKIQSNISKQKNSNHYCY